MQALEQGLGSLRLTIETWLMRVGWRRDSAAAGQRLARDLHLPAADVRDILDHTVADLHRLSDDDADPWPIIERAMRRIDQLGSRYDPCEEAAVLRYLRLLPERDRLILRCFNDGCRHSDIARLLGTDVDSVCNSLVKTYAGLRLAIRKPDDGGTPQVAHASSSHTTATKPVKPWLRHPTT
jgi:hypothetical protein